MILENAEKQADFANFFSKMTACFGDFAEFEAKIRQIADLAQIPLAEFEIDHLAVRMNDTQRAKQWYELLLTHANLLKESVVNGRPIALFTLYTPLTFCGKSVSIVELPFPKGKIYPQEGLEHIEIVIPFLTDETVAEWTKRICHQYALEQNPHITLKISQPTVLGEGLPNPTIAITTNYKTYCNNACLKIHPYDINTVIRSECVL
ncbi:metalloprotein [Pasteurellaceae bacterium Macca]|nr:metalloprotein [Pasteurellaceae bacterium Macca]